jgi:hypothetical protein
LGGTAELRTGVDATTLETAGTLDAEDFFAAMVVLLYGKKLDAVAGRAV